MTISFAGFVDDVTKTQWSTIHNLGNLGVTGMVPVDTTGARTVSVPTGKLAAAGILTEVTAAENLVAGTNSSGSTRIDLVVVRMTWGATNTSVLAIKAGTPGADQPTLQQDPGVLYEVPLARLTVANGQGEFTSGDIIALPSAGADVTVEQANDVSISGTTFAAGASVCGAVFVAPPSGKVVISVSGQIDSVTTNGTQTVLGYEVRFGSTVGSGTVVKTANIDHALKTGKAVNAGGAAHIGGSYTRALSGLTPGAAYNVRTMHRMDPSGNGNAYNRELLIRPGR